jgi:hypothetical protein
MVVSLCFYAQNSFYDCFNMFLRLYKFEFKKYIHNGYETVYKNGTNILVKTVYDLDL